MSVQCSCRSVRGYSREFSFFSSSLAPASSAVRPLLFFFFTFWDFFSVAPCCVACPQVQAQGCFGGGFEFVLLFTFASIRVNSRLKLLLFFALCNRYLPKAPAGRGWP